VIDRACVIPEGMVIGENAEEDARRFAQKGIVLVTREMLRKLGTNRSDNAGLTCMF
jgi:glucose-1-phosphate adenylyltransferase